MVESWSSRSDIVRRLTFRHLFAAVAVGVVVVLMSPALPTWATSLLVFADVLTIGWIVTELLWREDDPVPASARHRASVERAGRP